MYAATDICVQDFFSNKSCVSTVDKHYFLNRAKKWHWFLNEIFCLWRVTMKQALKNSHPPVTRVHDQKKHLLLEFISRNESRAVEWKLNLVAHGDAREEKWRGKRRMEWVASSLQLDSHSKKASTRLNWYPRRYKWTRPFRWKTESGFCACAITFRFHSTSGEGQMWHNLGVSGGVIEVYLSTITAGIRQ